MGKETVVMRSKFPSARNLSRAVLKKQLAQLQKRKVAAEQELAKNPNSQALKAKLFLINRDLNAFQGDVEATGL